MLTPFLRFLQPEPRMEDYIDVNVCRMCPSCQLYVYPFFKVRRWYCMSFIRTRSFDYTSDGDIVVSQVYTKSKVGNTNCSGVQTIKVPQQVRNFIKALTTHTVIEVQGAEMRTEACFHKENTDRHFMFVVKKKPVLIVPCKGLDEWPENKHNNYFL